MVIVELMGGLGNQLFQYALGKTLAIKKGFQIKFDITFFRNNNARHFNLEKFHTEIEIASEKELNKYSYKEGTFGAISKSLDRLKPWYERKVVREPAFRFSPDIWKINDNCTIKGYWQSEKYFLDIREKIKNEIKLIEKMSKDSRSLLETIKNEESVSIHVRRGDYVSNPITNAFHGICSEDYYRKAVTLIQQKNPGISRFFVFSDDQDWVKRNFSIGVPFQTVGHKTVGQECEDLILMSSCAHHVIANSSFSWWGAWLSDNPDKAVIAPEKWFNEADLDTRDLIPRSWQRI